MKDFRRMFKDNKIIIPVLSLILILVLGITYAWLHQILNGEKRQVIKAGTLNLVLDDELSQGINLDRAIPMSDRQGLATQAYTFEVRNEGTIDAEYVLYLEDEDIDDGEIRLDDSKIRYSLTKNGSNDEAKDLTELRNRKLTDILLIHPGATDTYTLKLWIRSQATVEEADKIFKARIKLKGTQTGTNLWPVEFLEGANQTVMLHEEADFRLDEVYGEFDSVYVDDTLINPSEYSSESGSTKIHFPNELIRKLGV